MEIYKAKKMSTINFKHLLASLVAMVSVIANAQITLTPNGDVQYNKISYYLDAKNKTATVTYAVKELDYNHYFYMSDITIPSTITVQGTTYRVTGIGENAFYKCESINNISIPESVTSIDKYAFYYCTSLRSIALPSRLTFIGDRAFRDCHLLSSLSIPEGVTSIGNGAFYECESLPSIVVPESVTSMGNFAFAYCTKLSSITIPEGITNIGDGMFSNCTSLSSFIIPQSVTGIGAQAFSGCSSLASITIPGVQAIGKEAFKGAGLSIIKCESEIPCQVANDAFDSDMYEKTVLYVPTGCDEKYMMAPVWCLFSKLRTADLGAKDCTLAIKSGAGGCIKMACRTKSSYHIMIETEKGWTISSVTFNGADVTSRVSSGTYTTPSLTDNSELCIVFEKSGSAVKEVMTDDPLYVSASNGALYINNADKAMKATVYTADGKQVKQAAVPVGATRIPLSEGQLYIIKVGDRTFKVTM